jgi:hypothetical protein
MDPRFPVAEETLWFVFHEDRQLGPFLTSELATRMNEGEISEESFIWAQGFSDWIQAHEMPGLANYRMDLLSFERAAHVERTGNANQDSGAQVEDPHPDKTIEQFSSSELDKTPPITPIVSIPLLDKPDKTFWVAHRYKLATAISFLLILSTSIFVKNWNDESLAQFGLSGPDQVALKSAASQSRLLHGPTAEIVLASAQGENPRFVIGSNLNTGSKLEIKVEGVPGKLLDRVRYAMKTTMRTNGKFLVTERLSEIDGKPFRGGAYKVSVRELNQDLLLTTKTFLMGNIPGGDFETALAAYNEKQKNQSKLERIEIEELYGTTSRILTEMSQWFAAAEDKSDIKTKWQDRAQNWESIVSQLTSLAQQWSKEPLASEIIDLEAYRKLGEMIEQLQAARRGLENFVQSIEPEKRILAREQLSRAWLHAQASKEALEMHLRPRAN